MIDYLINILVFLTLMLKDVSSAHLPRTTREFDPNKLMEQYMKLRTDIDHFGSYHPNDLINAIKDFQAHKQDSKALDKSKQQITGKGFDPNGQSMFTRPQLSDWGFSYYNPNIVMEQYLGDNKGTGSYGSQVTNDGQASKVGGNSHNGNEGSFNADKLNSHLMSSFKDNPFSTDFSGEGFHQEGIKSSVAGFNPDKLNYNLMSILNKDKAPVSGEYHIKQYGMGNSDKKENNTSYNFMEPNNYSLQTNAKSAFDPDTLNALLIGSLGYDATAINKETSGPVSSFIASMNKVNSTENFMFPKQESLTSTLVNGAPIQQGSGNQHGSAMGSVPGNQTVQTGYHAVNSGNNQETLHNPLSIHSNQGMIGQQTSGMFSSNQGAMNEHVSSGNAQNNIGVLTSQVGKSPEVAKNHQAFSVMKEGTISSGNEISNMGSIYSSGNHAIQNSNLHESVANHEQSANVHQTDVSNKNSISATGIGSLGIGITGATGGQSFQNFGIGAHGYHVTETSTHQGLPGLNGSPVTQTQQIKQTGAENISKVKATGIGSLGVPNTSGKQNLVNGDALAGQQYIFSQVGSNNASGAQATGIGSLGTGYQHGFVDKNNLNSYKGNGGEVIQQTISGNVKYVAASGIGGLGTSDHITTAMPNTGVNQGVSFSGVHSNVVGIGGLGGKSHFGNFENLDRKEKIN